MKARPSLASAPSRAEALPPLPSGEFVEQDGERWYRIAAFHRLTPFLMSLPSDTDLWMFVASGGGLTAGRVDAEGSLFPYLPVDQLHDAHHHTGPVTLLQVAREKGQRVLWEPLAEASVEDPAVERNLYKNVVGNRLVFEEIHQDLQLAFRYRWSACDEFGWVRTASLENLGEAAARVTLLDGVRNVLPHGAPLALQQQASNLVDAYKQSEIDLETGLGIFSLTASITDRAEAVESLRANTVWCCGLERFQVHLSLGALADFRSGSVATDGRVVQGARGNYLVTASLELAPGERRRWHVIGDTGLDHVEVAALRQRLRREEQIAERVEESLRRARENLLRNVASADGLQLTAHDESSHHHLSNVLFNNMRGGVFLRNYEIPVADLRRFLHERHRAVASLYEEALAALPEFTTLSAVLSMARERGDTDLERLAHEYLPLHFGRRHGDPSRPWNRFSIQAHDGNGGRRLHYEGNWRDIFQNWEALGTAFPGFLPSMVAKFVNASTVDGFNPYRITRDGVDWETVSPDDPWSNIGYWGDHQINYLLKLLEAMDRHDPAAMSEMLASEIFSYADVPYRILPYEDILRDPSATIAFDDERAARIAERVERRGADGKLLPDPEGSVYHANLLEKLLVPALSKLSNLIPDAGIWMNTQRPEWNDANNALAGGGVSVVTLCYLRRYLGFLAERLEVLADTSLMISEEVVEWFENIEAALEGELGLLESDVLDPDDRKRMMDALGGAFSEYRDQVYRRGFSGKSDLSLRRVIGLCATALRWIDRSLAAQRRPDGLFHTYNRLEFGPDHSSVRVVHLPEMLEGQVAVLSSGHLEPAATLELLRRLFDSSLYRSEQRSFLLQPDRELPGFLEKNAIPAADVGRIPLLRELLQAEDASLLSKDAEGTYRFHGDLRNAASVAAALDTLATRSEWSDAVARDREAVLALHEDVFGHRSYTGRSGVMFAYEGLGCIYWHMVAKLLLAVQENVLRARDAQPVEASFEDLARMYYRIRGGLGFEKTVTEFGAFPTDPYSHTPSAGGARQPGMTGQVKEEILTRAGELGILIDEGVVSFRPTLLRLGEFLQEERDFEYFDVAGDAHSMRLGPGTLAFTLCQVPVRYERVEGPARIRVDYADGRTAEHAGDSLDVPTSAEIFARSGRVASLRVDVPASILHQG